MDRELEELEAFEARALLQQRRMRALFLWLQSELRPILLKWGLSILGGLFAFWMGLQHVDLFSGSGGLPLGLRNEGQVAAPLSDRLSPPAVET